MPSRGPQKKLYGSRFCTGTSLAYASSPTSRASTRLAARYSRRTQRRFTAPPPCAPVAGASLLGRGADAAGPPQGCTLARQTALWGKRVAVLAPEAYGGCKDASEAWVAGGCASEPGQPQ